MARYEKATEPVHAELLWKDLIGRFPGRTVEVTTAGAEVLAIEIPHLADQEFVQLLSEMRRKYPDAIPLPKEFKL